MVETSIDSVTAEPLNFELDEPFEIASGKKKKIDKAFGKSYFVKLDNEAGNLEGGTKN